MSRQPRHNGSTANPASDTTPPSLGSAEEYFRFFLSHAPAAIAMFDRDMRYILTSQRWLNDYGLAGQQIIGRSHYEVFPEIPERWKEIHRRCLEGAVEACQEEPFYRQDGSVDWVRWEIHPWREHSGRIGGIIMFTEVITARKAAELALKQTSDHLAQILDGIPVPAFVIDDQHIITHWNQACANLTGIPASEMIGTRNQWQAFYPSQRPVMADLIVDRAGEETLAAYYAGESHCSTVMENAYEAECFFTHFGKSGTWLYFTAAPLMSADGAITGAIEALQDVTARKKAEQELQQIRQGLEQMVAERTAALTRAVHNLEQEIAEREKVQRRLHESEITYRELFDNMRSGVAIYEAAAEGKDFLFKDFNKAAERIEQISKQDLLHRSIMEVFPGVKQFGLFQVLQRVWKSGVPEHHPASFYQDQRISGWRENYVYRLPTGEVVAVYDDITEKVAAAEALQESEASLTLAVESTGLGRFEYFPRTGQLNWSDAAKRHYGLPPEVPGDYDTFVAGLHPDDRERVLQALAKALVCQQGGEFSTEYRTIGIADGRERWLAARGKTTFDKSGTAVRLTGICLDITDSLRQEQSLKEQIALRLQALETLRQQEQLLIQQGRLAAMGEMIGNIAHQWRQPLNTLGLILQELPLCQGQGNLTDEFLNSSVTRAMELISHMSKTIDGFRNFLKPDKQKITFKISEVLQNVVSMVEKSFSDLNIVLEIIVEDDLSISGSPNEFSQVILNLLMNCKDAFVERKVEQPRIEMRVFRENEGAVLGIADNAGGIPSEILDKIFDPYFTTKGPAHGTGIGLFMSRTIIRNMEGTLSVANTAGGADFRIKMPLSEKQQAGC